jgi:diguanylate cyclase (GGDEF)-like protein/PAS domain S-box-containing protein
METAPGSEARLAKQDEALPLCEARLQTFLDQAAEWYWEQDEAYRFTLARGSSLCRTGIDPKQVLGTARWDGGALPAGAGMTWDAHHAVLEARQPFIDFIYRRVNPRGELRYICTSGRPVFDRQNRFAGYRGTSKDVTQRVQMELRIAIEHDVTRVLEASESIAEASPQLIRVICEALRWACGTRWQPDESGALRCADGWGAASPDIQAFLTASRGQAPSRAPGGLNRRVQNERRPLWLLDVTQEPSFRRAPDAERACLRSAFAFPIKAGAEVIGVMEFFTHEMHQPDTELLDCMAYVGSQIGQFIKRTRAEAQQRESEARFRSLTQLSSDFYWETDAEHRLRAASHGSQHRPVLAKEQLHGKARWELASIAPDAAGWAAHRATLEAHLPFQDFEIARIDAEGAERHLAISGEPVFDEAGRFRGYRGLGKDITARKREERLLALEHAVTRSLAEADSIPAALQAVMRAVCQAQGWECGRYFRHDEDAGLFRFLDGWHEPGSELERFIAYSATKTFPMGAGIVGRAGAGEPQWAKNLAEDRRVVSKPMADVHGMRAAFMFPVIAEGRALGVLSFTSREIREPDERLLLAVRNIGSQIGQFIRRKQAEEEQRESEARYRGVVESINEGVVVYDHDLKVVSTNAAAERIVGLPLAGMAGAPGFTSLLPCIREDGSPLPPEERPTRLTLSAGKPLANLIFGIRRQDRSVTWLSVNTGFLRRPGETDHYGLVSTLADITVQREAEAAVRQSEERFRSLTQLSSDIYWEQDRQFRFTSFAGIGLERVKLRNLPATGRKLWEHSYVNTAAEDWARHIELMEAHQPFRDLELCTLDEADQKVWISFSGEPMFDAAGHFNGYRGVGKDITARKLDEERIQFLANHDALTSLPNRARFSYTVDLAIQNARRYNRQFAVLFIDLDRFKIINDTLGHDAGDKLLREISVRLTDTVRSSDVVARLGGDEFTVLVQEVGEPKQVEPVARKLLSALMKPVTLHGQECRVTASIGISMYPADAQDEQALMKHADIAMYRAKEEGKNTYQFYSAESNAHAFERMAMESSLRRALEREEFFLHYQAKINLKTRAITGVEALVRWHHPELGMVAPAQFIPLAEETGLIVPLGKWVLNTACMQNLAWQRDGLPALRMSVNLSARQFADEHLLEDIAAALAATGMDPRLLELELTESMVMQNTERAGRVLAAIKEMGVRLAIDDFGVGYSSLTHLKRFPIDTLKVDRSFIRDLPQDSEDKALTEAIIAMGKSLNLTVVAEGVETLEQENFLREHACDESQGYYFSRPIAGNEFADLLRRRLSSPPR